MISKFVQRQPDRSHYEPEAYTQEELTALFKACQRKPEYHLLFSFYQWRKLSNGLGIVVLTPMPTR
jgi:hypothetical protein